MDQDGHCFQVAKFVYECMEYIVWVVSGLLYFVIELERIGKVTCMTRFLLISAEGFRRMVLVLVSAHGAQVTPPGRPLGGPICIL
jgi:hypothetical protein